MKTYITIFALCIICTLSIAQNPDHKPGTGRIILKDGSVIKDAELYFIYADLIEYQKHGSLHDLLISEIDWIVTSQEVIVFDENNRARKNRRLDLLVDIKPMNTFVSVLSNYVGEEINQSERDYYWLFPGIKGFISARWYGIHFYNTYRYNFKIKYRSLKNRDERNDEVRDTIITINGNEINLLTAHFFLFENILYKEKKVNRFLIRKGIVGSRPIVSQPQSYGRGKQSAVNSQQSTVSIQKTITKEDALVRPLRDGTRKGRWSDESAAQNKKNDNISNKNQPAVITLKNKKTLKDVRLYEIQPNVIVYEKEGSLHDLLIG